MINRLPHVLACSKVMPMFFRRGSSWSGSSNQAENRLGAIDRLLDRARNGEVEAVSALYHHFFPGIFSYITSHTSDRGTAEDLTSEVFLAMVEHIHQVKASNEADFSAWLLRVAKFTVAGYYRKREKQPVLVSLEATLGADDGTYEERYAIDENDPALCLEERDEWSTVMQAINKLTAEQRQVIIQRLILGYDIASVARMTGKKANAVKALQFRALRSLQRILAEQAQSETSVSSKQLQEEAL
jgi:RNA polymerase sigma-70 factor, ECF subfamily